MSLPGDEVTGLLFLKNSCSHSESQELSSSDRFGLESSSEKLSVNLFELWLEFAGVGDFFGEILLVRDLLRTGDEVIAGVFELELEFSLELRRSSIVVGILLKTRKPFQIVCRLGRWGARTKSSF